MKSRLKTHRNLVKFSIVNLVYEIAARDDKILCIRKEICDEIMRAVSVLVLLSEKDFYWSRLE